MAGLGETSANTTKVRTAEDVERKYNLANLKTDLESIQGDIVETQKELNEFIVTTTDNFQEVEQQLDGKVETWYYSGSPSSSVLPESEWTTSDIKHEHIGDLYYDQSTGYVYRYNYSGGTYSWVVIHDSTATTALANANAAQDTADHKRRVFMSQPTPPYDNGDLWVQGSNGDVMACQISKTTGQSYDANDWILASKYTDNTLANAIVDEMGGTTTTVLSGQVVTIMNNYAKFTDLATGGSTTIAGENITTGSIQSANYVVDTSGTKLSLTTGAIDTKGFKVDSTGNITSTAGTIGGFSISGNSFSKSLSGLYNYDLFDLGWARGIILSNLPETNSALDVLDYNDSGDVGAADMLSISKIIAGTKENERIVTGTFEINSNDAKRCVAVKDTNDNIVAYMGLGGLGGESLTCESIAVTNKTSYDTNRVDINGTNGNLKASGSVIGQSGLFSGVNADRQAIVSFVNANRVKQIDYVSGSPGNLSVELANGNSYGITIWTSDKRLKHDIKDSSYNALDTINQIKHREFTYNENDKYIPIGYVADELEEIDKNLIYEVGEDKIKQPDISTIIPILSKAIQEQQSQINELKKEIELLRKEK